MTKIETVSNIAITLTTDAVRSKACFDLIANLTALTGEPNILMRFPPVGKDCCEYWGIHQRKTKSILLWCSGSFSACMYNKDAFRQEIRRALMTPEFPPVEWMEKKLLRRYPFDFDIPSLINAKIGKVFHGEAA